MGAARVLVVDDEPLVLDLVCRMLARAGYHVLRAGGAAEALQLVKSADPNPIHVVVSDVVMPDMGGPELLREITRICPSTQSILMSGYAPEQLPPEIPFIRKPLSSQQLVAAVERVLAGAAEARHELSMACVQNSRLRAEARGLGGELRELERKAVETVQRSKELLKRPAHPWNSGER